MVSASWPPRTCLCFIGSFSTVHRIRRKPPGDRHSPWIFSVGRPGTWQAVQRLRADPDRGCTVLLTLIKSTEKRWGTHPQVLQAICRLLEQVTEMDAGLLSQPIQNRLWDPGPAADPAEMRVRRNLGNKRIRGIRPHRQPAKHWYECSASLRRMRPIQPISASLPASSD